MKSAEYNRPTRPTIETCAQPWKEYNKKCYQLMDKPVIEWRDGHKQCHSIGARLPIISSQEENEFVLRYAKETRFPGLQLWLGLHRRADDTFEWVDGTTEDGNYSNWVIGEPSNIGGNEDCGEMIVAGTYWLGQWNDINCSPESKQHILMCEKPL